MFVAGFFLFFDRADTALDCFQIFNLKVCVDDILVANRIDTPVNMRHVVIVETSEYMYDGIGITDIAQEFVAQSFAFRGAFHQAGDVDYFYCSRDDPSWVVYFCQCDEAFVGDCDDTDVRFDGAKWKISCLGAGARKTVE